MNLYQKMITKEKGAPAAQGGTRGADSNSKQNETSDNDDLQKTLVEIDDDVGSIQSPPMEGSDSELPVENGYGTQDAAAAGLAPQPDEESPAAAASTQNEAEIRAQTVATIENQRQTAFEGVLAEDPQQARDQMLEDAVDAEDVRVFDETGGKWKRWMPVVIIVLVLLVLVVVGATLGVVIPRRNASFGTAMPTDLPSEAPSAAPSQAPTTTSFAVLAQAVEAAFGTTLEDTTSPQYKAALWMTEEDQLITSPLDDLSRFAQRYAMVVFYYSTGGDVSWSRQANFLSPALDICEWQENAPEGSPTILGILGTQCVQGQLYAIELS